MTPAIENDPLTEADCRSISILPILRTGYAVSSYAIGEPGLRGAHLFSLSHRLMVRFFPPATWVDSSGNRFSAAC